MYNRIDDYFTHFSFQDWIEIEEISGSVCLLGHLDSCFSVGDLLIIMAQVIVAIQMVLEEKFIYKHNVHPLQAVGTEGM